MIERNKWAALLLACLLSASGVAAVDTAGEQPPAAGTAQAASGASPTTSGLSATDTEIAQFFDAYMTAKVDQLEAPGAAVVVVRDGRTLLAKGYGVSDWALQTPVDVDRTLFRAASISKLLPWLLAMQLVEEGTLDLDADVNAYLDFEIPAEHGEPVTMRRLMTHTAGFPERFHGVFDPDLATPLGRKLRDNLPPRVYVPGTTVAYANYGAGLAGYIVERLRGAPWQAVVEQRVFEPLQMHWSTIAQPVPETFAAHLALNYAYGETRPGEFRTTSLPPLGSLSASAADMGRLLAMLADGLRGVDGPIVSSATVQRMVALDHPLGPGLPDGMGLGFLVGEYHGVRYAGHAGNMSDLATDLELLPDHGLGWYYVFTTQGPREDARKVRDDLLRATIDAFIAPGGQAVAAVGASTAGDIAGLYVSTRRLHSGPLMFSGLMNTTEAIANADGTLTIHSSGTATDWLPVGTDRFVERVTGILLAATRGPDGRVERIASAALYPAAQFDRAPAFLRAVPPVAAFSFAMVLAAALVLPVARGVRAWRSRYSGALHASRSRPRGHGIRRWAGPALCGLVLTVLGWAAVGLAMAIDFGALFTVPLPVRVLLGALTLASAPLALVLVADAVLGWNDPARGWSGRIGRVLVAVAATGVALLFYAFDVWNFSNTW